MSRPPSLVTLDYSILQLFEFLLRQLLLCYLIVLFTLSFLSKVLFFSSGQNLSNWNSVHSYEAFTADNSSDNSGSGD